MKCFENAMGINVPRARFLPVKKTSGTCCWWCRTCTACSGALVMSPKRMFPFTPLVKLGHTKRKVSIPLQVRIHPVYAGAGIYLPYPVTLPSVEESALGDSDHHREPWGQDWNIPAGAILENKIVSRGNPGYRPLVQPPCQPTSYKWPSLQPQDLIYLPSKSNLQQYLLIKNFTWLPSTTFLS